MFQKIVVVCTGNICRSPIAEAVMRRRISKVEICSAGIAALINHPADPLAQLVAEENGYDLSAHRAQQATAALLTSADLILTLDQTHNDWIRTRLPQLQGRAHKLGRWRNNMDIADPYCKPKLAFDSAIEEISLCTEDWAKRI